MKTMSLQAALVAALTLLGSAGFAQEDNAGTISGHDPNARPALRPQEIELPLVAEKQADKLFGLGYSATPGGVAGAAFEYYVGGKLMIEGILGLSLFSPKNGDSGSVIALAGGVFYRWKTWDNVSLMAGGRLEIAHESFGRVTGLGKLPQTTTADSATQFDIEVPLRAELYFARFLSVHAEVAVVASIVGDAGTVLVPSGSSSRGKGFYIDVPLDNLFGSLGATFYFP